MHPAAFRLYLQLCLSRSQWALRSGHCWTLTASSRSQRHCWPSTASPTSQRPQLRAPDLSGHCQTPTASALQLREPDLSGHCGISIESAGCYAECQNVMVGITRRKQWTFICSLVSKNPCSCAAFAFWRCYVKTDCYGRDNAKATAGSKWLETRGCPPSDFIQFSRAWVNFDNSKPSKLLKRGQGVPSFIAWGTVSQLAELVPHSRAYDGHWTAGSPRTRCTS